MEGDGRAHIDDASAVARHHAPQRHPRAVHRAQIGHLRDALERLGRRIEKAAERGVTGAIHPNVDRSQRVLDGQGGGLQRMMVGDVGLNRHRAGAKPPDILASRTQPGATTRDKPHPPALTSKQFRGGPTDSRRCARDNDHARHAFGQLFSKLRVCRVETPSVQG